MTFRGLVGFVLAGLVTLTGCGGLDERQARLCERILPAIEAPDATIRVTDRRSLTQAPPAVRLDYLVDGPDHAVRPAHAVCTFGGSGFAQDRLRLEAVATDRGPLTPVEVFMLRTFWLDRYEPRAGSPSVAPDRPGSRLGFVLQLLTGALVLASIYGLLATSFTLVFGLTRRINLAFGAVAVLGAYAAFTVIMASVAAGGLPLVLLLPVLILAVGFYGGITGPAFERTLFRPLARSGPQALLIASLGLAIFLEEALRLLQGSSERWVQPVLAQTLVLVQPDGFPVTVTPVQLGCLVVGLGTFAGLQLLVRRTTFGRALRAAADDPDMAALCGVRTHNLLAGTLALSGGLAALAGAVLLLRYGTISSHDGWLITFKALTAAVIGGIGRTGGAALGALLIALMETFWAAYFGSAWRDVAVFAALALALILRPSGLLGGSDLAIRLQRPAV